MVSFHDTYVVKKEQVVARHLVYLGSSWKEKERKFDKMDADNTSVIGKVT